MSRNARNGLWKRMEQQELSLMGNSMKASVRPPVRPEKPIRDDYYLKSSFRL